MSYAENQLSFQEPLQNPIDEDSSEDQNQTYPLISQDPSLGLPKKPTEDINLPYTMPQIALPTIYQ